MIDFPVKNICVLACLFGLVSCRQAETPPVPPPPPVATVKSHAAGVAAAQVIAPAEAAASRLALDGDGFRLFNSVSGASRLVPFGSTKADVLRILDAALKVPVRGRGHMDDCGASFVAWNNGLTAWFAKDRFAGWSATAASGASPPATAAGLRVGAARKLMAAAYDAKIAQSTLGTEFSAGALAGVLSSDQPDAHVIALWAGSACIAR